METETSPSRTFIVWTLIALVCIAIALRIDGASLYHMSPDDLNHMEMAQGHTPADVLHFSLFETHPPLGHLLRHYWLELSDALWFQRSLALIFGLMLIPIYYLIGTKLTGKWAGICSAALIAFSHGCIIQSYVIRNYTIFLFFLSCTLYAYLLWRQQRTLRLLALYALLGSLATLSHFSGTFGIFCIAVTECLCLLRPSQRHLLILWILANAGIAIIALATMNAWEPLLAFTRGQVHALTGNPHNWLYPVFVLDYLFVYRASVAYVFVLFILTMYALYICALRIPAARMYAVLAALALFMGSLLVISGTYQAGINRCSLWLLPFIAPPVGCALSLLCARARAFLPNAGIVAVIMILGYASYSPAARYRDISEYMMTESEWSEYTHYLGSLDASHLIIASRSDAFLVSYPYTENLYDFYAPPRTDANGVFVPANLTAIVPYHRLRLLFKPYYFNYSPSDLITITNEADEQGKLKDVSTLVFTSTLWSRNTTLNLILCPSLDKTISSFPLLPASHKFTKEELETLPALVLSISKQAFFDELAAPEGKARACLKTL